MGRGAAPGERRGGKAKGTPNKATVARAVQAEADVIKHQVSGKKLAKDMLDDYMLAFHAVAASYQRSLADAFQAGVKPAQADLDAFMKWGELVVDTAAQLAKYQSPTFKAIQVNAPMPLPKDAGGKIIEGTVIKLDEISISKVYRQLVAGDK